MHEAGTASLQPWKARLAAVLGAGGACSAAPAPGAPELMICAHAPGAAPSDASTRHRARRNIPILSVRSMESVCSSSVDAALRSARSAVATGASVCRPPAAAPMASECPTDSAHDHASVTHRASADGTRFAAAGRQWALIMGGCVQKFWNFQFLCSHWHSRAAPDPGLQRGAGRVTRKQHTSQQHPPGSTSAQHCASLNSSTKRVAVLLDFTIQDTMPSGARQHNWSDAQHAVQSSSGRLHPWAAEQPGPKKAEVSTCLQPQVPDN